MRALAALPLLWAVPLGAVVPVQSAEVVRTYPHDRKAFTEGLFYLNGALYEATGQVGQSGIRKVDLATGRVLAKVAIPAPTFGEGIAPWMNQIVSLTWKDGHGWRWTLDGFRRIAAWTYPGEGWALTSDGKQLIMSDGTAQLRYLDPVTLKEVRRINVTYEGQPLPQLNELEYVEGEILANVWTTDRIVRIDPASGKVVGMIDLSALHAKVGYASDDAVPNGIAWDKAGRRLFVTGKYWPTMFQIKPPKGP